MSSALSKSESLRTFRWGGSNAYDVAGMAALLASAGADYLTDATSVVDGGRRWNYQEQ